MATMIFPGSFDPFSLGHVDIAKRAARLCDRLIVAVMHNAQKKHVFSVAERVKMAKLCLKDEPTIEVIDDDGLLVDLFRSYNACAVVRGLRSESDFRNEAEMAAANRLLYADYELILLPCRSDLAFASSTMIKEVAMYKGDISGMVASEILPIVKQRMQERT